MILRHRGYSWKVNITLTKFIEVPTTLTSYSNIESEVLSKVTKDGQQFRSIQKPYEDKTDYRSIDNYHMIRERRRNRSD